MNHQIQHRWFATSLHLSGATVVALLVGAFYACWYRPLVQERVGHAVRVEQHEKLLSFAPSIRSEHQRLRKRLANIRDTVADVRRRMPAEPPDDAFVRDVRQLADRVGLEVLDDRRGVAQRAATHSQTEVSFRGRGSYASICRLLDEVEHLARITKVSKLELETSPNPDAYPFRVTFVLYYGVPANDTNERRAGLSRSRL